MEKASFSVEKRERLGKGGARSLRRAGFVPAIIYKGGNSLPVKLSGKELSQFISRSAGEQVIVNLQMDGDTRQAILKDFQMDPVSGGLLHADFQEISATEQLKVMVHVVVKGEAVGVKRDKGILQHGLREIEIECLPDQIPGHIDVDVTNLLIGHSIHVRDLRLAEGVRILSNPDEVVASVVGVKGEAAAEGGAETAEPEVIKKGKKTEE
ncbi:MAG: 50S ribosomal protein L25 [Alphaproteobacteria bacterium]|uniref:Large ribosomal subunit protein bL25 n=1 Tax=Candidatus Nitrobium versatile TaxID=2884831 RepID=A0A953M0Z3_9BACT|nr:50S ribosomal protein L25 [Candidatus Nitrobium versatile]